MNLEYFKNYFNKVKTFYSPDSAGYWNSLTKCCISKKPVQLDRYYLDFSSKYYYPGPFSSENIPLYSFKGQRLVEHPIVIAQYALGVFENLYSGSFNDDNIKTKFLKVADWFAKNKVNVCNGYGWLIKIKYPEYNLLEPWISGMAQGEAISVLSRAAKISGNNLYEDISVQALSPFEYDVNDGGLINYFNSIPVYEEFPTRDRTMAVLNGFIFALFGLYDLFLLNKNKKAFELFDKGIHSLKKLLPFYDIKTWTRYYLYNYPDKYYSSYTYHILVLEQLKALFYITEEKMFLDYSDRWLDYSNSFIKKNIALFKKIVNSNKMFSN